MQPFERVVVEHGATVLRVCRAMLGPVDADDAWSETFLAALRTYPDLPDGANVQAWLVTIAHRKAIDVVRARRRRALPVAEVDVESEVRVHQGVDHGFDQDLGEAIRRLPTRQRMAVAYHYLGGRPYAEVAALVGGSTDAARRAAADGVATLRRTYVREGIS